ncbi:hypothetical protein [Nocardia arthritidis]|uniref:Uncharacterized protein n=1 Tax=Nocardia arthritidis TaxID=228602 RepID=A0A6G9YDY9_9NOCA|nr:hypothetical protein [Nocardia arthritidis]QIS11495.1 hypothetical protein F5544_18105 [Nocardia arthritidis]
MLRFGRTDDDMCGTSILENPCGGDDNQLIAGSGAVRRRGDSGRVAVDNYTVEYLRQFRDVAAVVGSIDVLGEIVPSGDGGDTGVIQLFDDFLNRQPRRQQLDVGQRADGAFTTRRFLAERRKHFLRCRDLAGQQRNRLGRNSFQLDKIGLVQRAQSRVIRQSPSLRDEAVQLTVQLLVRGASATGFLLSFRLDGRGSSDAILEIVTFGTKPLQFCRGFHVLFGQAIHRIPESLTRTDDPIGNHRPAIVFEPCELAANSFGFTIEFGQTPLRLSPPLGGRVPVGFGLVPADCQLFDHQADLFDFAGERSREHRLGRIASVDERARIPGRCFQRRPVCVVGHLAFL